MAEPSAADRKAHAAITKRLAKIGVALPGTLLERRIACGKQTCRCQTNSPQLHSPYHQWTARSMLRPSLDA
jgi:hypothetical protein